LFYPDIEDLGDAGGRLGWRDGHPRRGLVLGTTAEVFLAALTSYAMAPRTFQVTVSFREEGLL